jgi:hypothetical protein
VAYFWCLKDNYLVMGKGTFRLLTYVFFSNQSILLKMKFIPILNFFQLSSRFGNHQFCDVVEVTIIHTSI